MFTGIVEGKRRVVAADRSPEGLRLEIGGLDLAEGVRVGDSIAVMGCCLTVEVVEGNRFRFFLMNETLRLTHFDRLRVGSWVHLERSLQLSDRLGGHLVSGHIDGLGAVTALDRAPGQTNLSVRLADSMESILMTKGSIAIDGVSLTIATASDRDFTVCLIPHTLEVTTLGGLRPGDPVHLELDMIGKWVRRFVPNFGT